MYHSELWSNSKPVDQEGMEGVTGKERSKRGGEEGEGEEQEEGRHYLEEGRGAAGGGREGGEKMGKSCFLVEEYGR